MPKDGLADDTSPFHSGERAIQARVGVREKMESFGRRVIRDHLPEQHRAFYSELPFLLVGTMYKAGRPWASMLVGQPGFVSSPDPARLRIMARPLAGDPLNETLVDGASIGLLGIQLETRRRNRMNGRIEVLEEGDFVVAVAQAFGNCPQCIQTRSVRLSTETDALQRQRPAHRAAKLDEAARALINKADTLFIASSAPASETGTAGGIDVSHRGGRPGFVRIEDDRTFVFPDFAGNFHFNTVGNLHLNPRAGFLFPDFVTGDLLYLTGRTEIVWDGPEVDAFIGAERLIRVSVDETIRVENGLPLSFDFGEFSPTLERTGSWEDTARSIEADRIRNTYRDFEVARIKQESDVITSFYLRPADGNGLASYEPGQFLPIRLSIPGRDEPITRTYTVSEAPNPEHYRLSVKREGAEALVSRFLHEHVRPGFRMQALAPRGAFALDMSSDRPVVLLSAGVGITPMIAMLGHIAAEGRRTRIYRKTYFIHGARNGAEHAFGPLVRRLAGEADELNAHIRFSRPGTDDVLGATHDSEGHLDTGLLKELLPFDDYDFYLCGPAPFMQALYDGLVALGVRDERIHFGSFGPASVRRQTGHSQPSSEDANAVTEPVKVRFAKSGLEASWSPDTGTLLDLAEKEGLAPTYSCRSGVCGSCATRLTGGAVDYLQEPMGPRGDDEAQICSATPRSGSEEIILDL